MTDDPIDEALVRGFELERQKLEALASKLGFPPETSSENSPAPPSGLDSDIAKDGALVLTDLLGAGLRALVFAERRPATPRPLLSRFFRSRAPPAPPPVVAPAPVPAPAPTVATAKMDYEKQFSQRTDSHREPAAAPKDTPKTSGTPDTAMSFVGFRDDRPKARESTRFPTEPLSAHVERLDLESDVRDQVRQRKLSGPVIGGIAEE